MLSLNYKRSIFKIREEIGATHFESDKNSDLTLRYELLFTPPESSDCEKFSFRLLLPNYLINLEEKESEIYRKIHKNTRYKINRAMNRDDLLYYELTSPTDSEIEAFRLFYDPFAKDRSIRLCDVNKLIALRDQGALIISYISDKNQKILCYHVYHIEEDYQGYLIYSASIRFKDVNSNYPNLIGRANRFLHWKDIQSFKNKGCKWYNFGGKIMDEEDKGGQNVNKFKQEFGTIIGYDSRIFYANNSIGRMGLFFLRLKWRKSPEYQFSKNHDSLKTLEARDM